MSQGKSYRTSTIDPDYRRQAKTLCYCELCQRDLDPTKPIVWIAFELDKLPEIIHPDDLAIAWPEIRVRRSPHHYKRAIEFRRVGPECAKKVKGWTMTTEAMLASKQWAGVPEGYVW